MGALLFEAARIALYRLVRMTLVAPFLCGPSVVAHWGRIVQRTECVQCSIRYEF